MLPLLPGDPPDIGAIFAGVGATMNDALTAVVPLAAPVGISVVAIFVAWKVIKRFVRG